MTRARLSLIIASARLRVALLYLLWPEYMIDTLHERFEKLPPKARDYLRRKHGFEP